MKVTVIYDSVFGNTEKVAQAMGAALETEAEVSVVKVADVASEFWAGLSWRRIAPLLRVTFLRLFLGKQKETQIPQIKMDKPHQKPPCQPRISITSPPNSRMQTTNQLEWTHTI